MFLSLYASAVSPREDLDTIKHNITTKESFFSLLGILVIVLLSIAMLMTIKNMYKTFTASRFKAFYFDVYKLEHTYGILTVWTEALYNRLSIYDISKLISMILFIN